MALVSSALSASAAARLKLNKTISQRARETVLFFFYGEPFSIMAKPLRVIGFGVGAFTHGMLSVLKEKGCDVSAYLTRPYGHYGPGLVGPTHDCAAFPNPCTLLQDGVDLVIPQSIDWAERPWRDEFLKLGLPILCPTGEALLLERNRDFARELCQRFQIPFPVAQVARNRLEAERILSDNPRPYVIKNPLCSPTSPIHTIVCETVEETRSWLGRIDYAEGVFLQEYLGRAEAGHIALVSNGEIHSLVTNQEYKRAFAGNLGIVAGAPLGGLVEQDPGDKYGLAKALLHPLLPWLREVKFHGPVQVTAVFKDGRWQVIEYNVRLGVTSGPMILRMLRNGPDCLVRCARDEKLSLEFDSRQPFGCSMTLAGYGYPYVQLQGPQLPVYVDEPLTCDVWWNEVARGGDGQLRMTGHRICDVVAMGETLPAALRKAKENIRKIRCLGSYYRPDVGESLWPPGNV